MSFSKTQDYVTVLQSKGPRLTKTWEQDGTITGHGRAKQHKVRSYPVNNIQEAAAVFMGLRNQPTTCVVRGDWIGAEASVLVPDPDNEREDGWVLRQMAYFTDVPHAWIVFDIDGYKTEADPVKDPEGAIREWIKACLPPEYHEIDCYWQLSSSAGHPSKAGELRAHLVFWLNRKFSSAEAAAYVTMAKILVDRAPLHVVQANYFADPVFAEGVVDPVANRAGLLQGFLGDVVQLEIDEGALAVAMLETARKSTGGGEGGTFVDPRTKKGIVGAFCRAFSIEDVLTAGWFPSNFERVTERRYTWLDGNGSAEGAYVTDDGMRLINTHNTAPLDTIGQGLNAYDLVRVYKFGQLDAVVPADQRTFWDNDLGSRPSDSAMKDWAKTLAEVKAELEAAKAVDNPFTLAQTEMAAEAAAERPVATAPAVDLSSVFGPADVLPLATVATEVDFIDTPHKVTIDERLGLVMGEKVKQRLFAMGVTDDERSELINSPALVNAWKGCFYGPANQRLWLLNEPGQLVQFPPADWERMVKFVFGDFLDAAALQTITARLATERGTDAADEEKAIRKSVWETFVTNVKVHRQRNEVSYRVDMFAKRASIVLTEDTAAVTYLHTDFPVRPSGLLPAVEEAILAEYREHFPMFEQFLELLLHARFAADRRNAFLHMQCLAGFGKGFLLQGVLGADGLGLVCEMSTKDIERALEGAPSGINPNDLVRAWVLAVDEFKAAKGELKQLNNRISLAAKNQMRAIVEVFLKLFLSAESVDSLAGSDGVEAQFADRFSKFAMADGEPRLDDRPLFQEHGKMTYRTVIANYAATKLNTGVAKMRELGEVAASKVSDDFLTAFHKEHGIANEHGLLSDHLPEVASDICALINEWALHKDGQGGSKRLDLLPNNFKLKLDAAITVEMGRVNATDAPTKLIIANKLGGLIKDYIQLFVDRSSTAMFSFKASNIAALVTGRVGPLGAYYNATGERVKTRGAVLVLTQTAEMVAAAEEFGTPTAKVLDFPV